MRIAILIALFAVLLPPATAEASHFRVCHFSNNDGYDAPRVSHIRSTDPCSWARGLARAHRRFYDRHRYLPDVAKLKAHGRTIVKYRCHDYDRTFEPSSFTYYRECHDGHHRVRFVLNF
jgi:hypothetical protein